MLRALANKSASHFRSNFLHFELDCALYYCRARVRHIKSQYKAGPYNKFTLVDSE